MKIMRLSPDVRRHPSARRKTGNILRSKPYTIPSCGVSETLQRTFQGKITAGRWPARAMTASTRHAVRVKFISRFDSREWVRYFPDENGSWGGCEFVFDRNNRDYDWLIVYDDIAPGAGQTRGTAAELLACPRDRTLLITTEPASIKTYGRAFAAQFGHVLTNQPAWALPHARRYFQQTANHWFFGSGTDTWMSRGDLLRGPHSQDKAHAISVVHSSKRQHHTLHAQRFRFIEILRRELPEMVVFGRIERPVDDKAEALTPFRYHLSVENHVGPHHITEKLTDAFLARCLPFYAGAPNAADYFPVESFVPIDIGDPVGTAARIREAIANDEWSARLPAIDEARRRVLEEQNVFAVACRIISASDLEPASIGEGASILGRHAWRRRHAFGAFAHGIEKLYVRVRSLFGKRVS